MESKKSFGKQIEQILVGKGFYIVMALCAAIIGVSIWSLFRTPAKITPDESEFDEVLSEIAPVEEYEPVESVSPAVVEEKVSKEEAGLHDE